MGILSHAAFHVTLPGAFYIRSFQHHHHQQSFDHFLPVLVSVSPGFTMWNCQASIWTGPLVITGECDHSEGMDATCQRTHFKSAHSHQAGGWCFCLVANKTKGVSKAGLYEADSLVQSIRSDQITSSSLAAAWGFYINWNICHRARVSLRDVQNVYDRLLLLIFTDLKEGRVCS